MDALEGAVLGGLIGFFVFRDLGGALMGLVVGALIVLLVDVD